MSYMRMTVYSFTCDQPGGCLEGYESLPPFGDGLPAALREIRLVGWTVRGGKHYCPDHKPAPKEG